MSLKAQQRRERKRQKREGGGRTIVALTERQREYLRALRHHELTFCTGPAGTGKTYVAAVHAADLLVRGVVTKLYLARPAVAVDQEQHGFLPGDLRRKFEPWARPVFDVIRQHCGVKRFDDMVRSGAIETVPLAYMRGRTFSDAFVLLDEAQNTTPNQIRLFLTRIGERCRVIVDGDTSQCDLDVEEDGLTHALMIARRYAIPCAVIEFGWCDVVRSGMCRHWLRAFSEEDQRRSR